MARSLNKLTAVEVKAAQPGKYCDGGGLWLIKQSSGSGQWVFRAKVHGRRREMGLGGIGDVSLKDARAAAAKCRLQVAQEIDPIKQREKERRETARNLHVLNDIAKDAFESRKAELKGDGVAGRWWSPLKLYVLPKLGKVPVSEIDQADIRDTLAPIWHAKADTAKKALNRLAICLKHGAVLGLDVDLQATVKAKALLGKQRHKVEHIASLPWQDVPAFYASLSDGSITHLALRLLILTGARCAPLRFLRLEQIEGDIWTIPGEAMKGRRGATPDFRVPLSQQALDVIEQAMPLARDGYLFPSVRKGVISDATMSRLMERRRMAERPHGFRSSLRDWIAETTDTPYEIAETCIAHVVGGAVERSYRRTDYLEQRQVIMARWGKHVAGQNGQVLQMVLPK